MRKSHLVKTDVGHWCRILLDRQNANPLDFAAACETVSIKLRSISGNLQVLNSLLTSPQYRRKIMIKRNGDSTPRTAISYSIASVFVPSSKRGQGHSKVMLRLLHDQFRSNASTPEEHLEDSIKASEKTDGYGKDALLSFLFSDIGSFYAPLGWKTHKPYHVEWKVTGPKKVEQVVLLQRHDVERFAQNDQSFLYSNLTTQATRGLASLFRIRGD